MDKKDRSEESDADSTVCITESSKTVANNTRTRSQIQIVRVGSIGSLSNY